MKTLKKRHIAVFVILAVGVGTTIAFQNFTKYEPLKRQKADDLFMSGALTDALKAAETDEKASQLASNVDPDQITQSLKRKKETIVIKAEVDMKVDDTNINRDPASELDEEPLN